VISQHLSTCKKQSWNTLFKQFNQCHRFVASSQKSGEPNLRLFQPYLRRRQTSLSQPCSRLYNGCGFPRGPIATQFFCFWWWVKNNSQQIECTICTESELASSCAALLLCSRCQKHELGEKNIIHQRSLFKQFNVIVLWPPHRSLENRIYDFSNPTWSAVKLHCLSALFKTNGCGFSRGPIATQFFCFWWWVRE
jgi:hypothetical protein